MRGTKNHIVVRVLALFTVALILLPATLKFAHIFEHHEHEVCQDEIITHLHQVDLDCEFQKFQLNTHFAITNTHFDIFPPEKSIEFTISQYQFLSKYQRLHFSLRGPPSLINTNFEV